MTTKIKHGVEVVPGKIAISDFLQEVSGPNGTNRFNGSWGELIDMARWNFSDNEPGTGSVNGDVILINVPAERFRTNIVKIDDTNRLMVEDIIRSRVEGEDPVPQKIIQWDAELPQAKFVKLVLYRADVLDKDDDRSSDAEWEIVSINSQPYENVPMHPETMRRNAEHNKGGTLREYSQEEWDDASEFWSEHAMLRSAKILDRIPDHLIPEVSDRGFKQYPAITGEYGGQFSVYESSGTEKGIWVLIGDEDDDKQHPVLLTAKKARMAAEVINAAIDNHFLEDE